MTVAVGSKTPLILQIPQLAHRLIFFFPSTRPICFPAFLFFVGIHLTITLFCLPALLFYSASREFKLKLQLPVPLRRASSTPVANKMYLVAGQRG
ncbi:hypothetical protein N7465_004343 [Penicillium sp. CMV-2018d]|nr:hypothetical protein N7465_004343 [Penicillium sp. CMV-2018d]